MDDFSILRFRRGAGQRKKSNSSRLCAPCLPLCLFVLITTSIVALGTFLWLHLGLREDLDSVRAHLLKVEAQCKETPEALHDYHIQLKFLDSNVSLFGDELKKINSEIVTIKKDVEKLKQSSADIKASIAAAPEIKTLPKDVVSLSESVASIGSKISALESIVKDLKEQQSTFGTTADSIAKQQDAIKEKIQELLNATSTTTRQDTETPLSSSSQQQVTDAIAQINSSLSPNIKQVEQLYKFVAAINRSLANVQERNNHTHEVTHSLQKFVQQNLTQRVLFLEEHDLNTNFDRKVVEDILNDKLFNCCSSKNLSLANSSSPASWPSLLTNANQLVGIYLQLYARLNPTGSWSTLVNGTEVAGRLLNQTLEGLFMEHDSDVQKLHGDLVSVSNNCESLVNQLSRNLSFVSQRVNEAVFQLGTLAKDVRSQRSADLFRTSKVNQDELQQTITPLSSSDKTAVPSGIISTLRRRPQPMDPNHQ